MSSIVKVIEVIGQSEKSWDDAAQNVLKEASKSVETVSGLQFIMTLFQPCLRRRSAMSWTFLSRSSPFMQASRAVCLAVSNLPDSHIMTGVAIRPSHVFWMAAPSEVDRSHDYFPLRHSAECRAAPVKRVIEW